MPGIWIRSQDKEDLDDISGKRLYINQDREGNYCIYLDLMNDSDGYIKLGAYESKGRALQVLDEIQARIEEYKKDEIYIEHGWEDADDLKTVYQMPAE